MSTFAAISKLRAAIKRANAADAELEQANETLQHRIATLRATRVCPTKNESASALPQLILGNDDETIAQKVARKASLEQYTVDNENSFRHSDFQIPDAIITRPETQVNSSPLDGPHHSLLQAEAHSQETRASGASGVVSATKTA